MEVLIPTSSVTLMILPEKPMDLFLLPGLVLFASCVAISGLENISFSFTASESGPTAALTMNIAREKYLEIR